MGFRVSPRSPSSSLWTAPAWWPGFLGSSLDSAWPSSLLCSSAGNQPRAKPLKERGNSQDCSTEGDAGWNGVKLQAILIKGKSSMWPPKAIYVPVEHVTALADWEADFSKLRAASLTLVPTFWACTSGQCGQWPKGLQLTFREGSQFGMTMTPRLSHTWEGLCQGQTGKQALGYPSSALYIPAYGLRCPVMNLLLVLTKRRGPGKTRCVCVCQCSTATVLR